MASSKPDGGRPLSPATHLSEDELAHLTRFIAAFVPKRRQSRWRTVLLGKPDKWARLSMDDLWEAAQGAKHVTLVDSTKVASMPTFAADPSAIIFRLQAEPHILRGKLSELMTAVGGDDTIISIHPGKLALATHHSGDWYLCRR